MGGFLGIGGVSHTADDRATQAAQAEAARQAAISGGTQQVDNTFNSQFTPDFYNQISQGYLNYAKPQLQSQYDDAQKQLIYSLGRSGTLDSSVRTSKEADLNKLFQTNEQSLADEANSYANNARNSVESARSGLLSNLQSTGDATGAANSAVSQAQALSAQPAYSPLSDLFSTFTGTLGTQLAQEKAAALSGGAYSTPFSTGLFGTPAGAVKAT